MVSNRKKPLGRLRSNTIALACTDSEVQLGLDDRWAIRICDLQPEERDWLLEISIRRHVPAKTAARRLGVAPERLTDLIAVLQNAGFWQPDLIRPSRRPLRAAGDGVGDLSALGALRGDNLGRQTMAQRAAATVAVLDSSRLGAAVARALATAGVGRLILPDQGPVQLTDLGLGGYQRSDVGSPRDKCLTEQLRRCSTSTALRDGDPDIVVVVAQDAVKPTTWSRLMGEAVPHLVLLTGEADLTVGPFVLPGRSSCINCQQMHATDADPAWPLLATQLRSHPERPVETILAATGAALAAAQVLVFLDGLRPASANNLIRIALPQATPTMIPAPPHPDCACQQLRRRAPEPQNAVLVTP